MVFRPKNSASARDIGQWQEQQAIIVNQFKHDLFEMGVVDNLRRYDGNIQDGSVVETISVSLYVDSLLFRFFAIRHVNEKHIEDGH